MRLDPRPAVSPRPGGASTGGRGPLPHVAAKAPDTRVQIPSAVSRPRDLGQRTYLLCEVGVMVTAPAGGEEEIRWWVPGTDEGTARAPERDNAAPSHVAPSHAARECRRAPAILSVAPQLIPAHPCPLRVAGGGG